MLVSASKVLLGRLVYAAAIICQLFVMQVAVAFIDTTVLEDIPHSLPPSSWLLKREEGRSGREKTNSKVKLKKGTRQAKEWKIVVYNSIQPEKHSELEGILFFHWEA
ncbi:hypothetical protein M434DRAFT_34207 [Hypoxylon sp. CO27-5]|nr:hypothetical protein M434DRAFT_34207 [Hypoxylon sp. CO27-5]